MKESYRVRALAAHHCPPGAQGFRGSGVLYRVTALTESSYSSCNASLADLIQSHPLLSVSTDGGRSRPTLIMSAPDSDLVFRDADPSEDDELARIMYNAFLPIWYAHPEPDSLSLTTLMAPRPGTTTGSNA